MAKLFSVYLRFRFNETVLFTRDFTKKIEMTVFSLFPKVISDWFPLKIEQWQTRNLKKMVLRLQGYLEKQFAKGKTYMK